MFAHGANIENGPAWPLGSSCDGHRDEDKPGRAFCIGTGMNYEINNRYTNACQWSGDIEDTGSASRNLGNAAISAIRARANLAGANLAGANLAGANLARANLASAYLSGAYLAEANLARANLARANLDGADLARADLARANLAGAYLARAYLAGDNLDGANLAGANLDGANLDGANLAGANLDGARLDGARLDGVRLDGAKLDGGEKLLTNGVRMISPIGSRSSYCTAYATEKGLRFRSGCFFGSVDEFRAKIAETHGVNHHAQDYLDWIAMCEVWFARLSIA